MIRHSPCRCALLLAILLAGCEPPAVSSTASANAPPGPPPVASPPAPDVAAAPTGQPVAATSGDWVADETAATQPTLPTSPVGTESAALPTSLPLPQPTVPTDAGPFISLSAGVAVPQLLPDGTQIGVSVDYSLRGQPRTSCAYFLVVESSAGEIAVPIKLDPAGGTFQGFLPLAVRPEHQPFRARIDEAPPQGARARVSNSAVLATSY